jgi:hypothetical protein
VTVVSRHRLLRPAPGCQAGRSEARRGTRVRQGARGPAARATGGRAPRLPPTAHAFRTGAPMRAPAFFGAPAPRAPRGPTNRAGGAAPRLGATRPTLARMAGRAPTVTPVARVHAAPPADPAGGFGPALGGLWAELSRGGATRARARPAGGPAPSGASSRPVAGGRGARAGFKSLSRSPSGCALQGVPARTCGCGCGCGCRCSPRQAERRRGMTGGSSARRGGGEDGVAEGALATLGCAALTTLLALISGTR